jgi:outer membrane protein OmpA-like peptidoglycan-associated protein
MNRLWRGLCAAATFTFVIAASSITLAAQSTELTGLIKARSGDNFLLQTTDGSEVTVFLTDSTNVGQYEGVLKARHKEMSMAALIPGLAVKVKGMYKADKEVEASEVRFKGNDLQRAQAMHAGMHETKVQAEANRKAVEAHEAELARQNAENQKQNAELAKQRASIDEAVARFGQLDDYYIFDEVTIYFPNGKTAVDPKYVPQLQTLAQKAGGINGYMIEVKGFASATGNTAVNQKLSEERANKVTQILIQQGRIPLTRMLAPGAMGESDQVGENASTKEGQAQNRRVVVRVLQNKAIAGKPSASTGQ